MTDSPAARRIPDAALRSSGADTPAARFDAYLDDAERDLGFRARLDRIAALRARPEPHPAWRNIEVAAAIVVLAALWAAVAVRVFG